MEELGRHLLALGCYADSAEYQVFLPQLSDPVVYRIELQSRAVPADTLAPCEYIIRWDLPTPNGTAHGFSAYFDGDHYRFGNNRLQEYHAGVDATAFAPQGRVAEGVQRRVQFAELLPQFVGENLTAMATDTTYHAQVKAAGANIKVEGVRRLMGFDALEFEYVFDARTFLPVSIDLESNPGQLGEQTISVHYGRAGQPFDCDFGLDRLMALEPEAFELYRTDSYSLEQLVGQPLPQIALPLPAGGRYIHHKGDPLATTTLLVFVDSSVGSTPDVIAAVRSAVAQLPGSTNVLWLFTDKRAEDVIPLTGDGLDGETIVLNSGAAARDLGVGAVTPVIVLADRAGKVRDFIRGFNNDLASVVIQKASLCAIR